MDKRSNFERIATKRVNKIIEDIESLKNLKNASYYKAEKKDFIKIVGALEDAVTDLEQFLCHDNDRKEFHL